MHIALIGATGPVGERLSAELLSRGHSITAISTHPELVNFCEFSLDFPAEA